jgi:Rad3-related DNA helicase
MVMESDFNFEKSPILKVSPMVSLAYKNKKQNLPIAIKRIEAIIEKLHPNERGIIHTGTFEIASALRKLGNNRLMFYNNSKDKQLMLDRLQYTKNGIVCGPSLVEGIDLKDDLARFCIVVKVPYPFLDEFNKRKMSKVEGWYAWRTMVQFLQAIGRPIRHKDDWAKTYLIDQCFDYFLHDAQIPMYIRDRIQKLDYNSLFTEEHNKELDELFSKL